MGSYTVAQAGLLKAKLEALSDVLTRTPFEQHKELHFDEVLELFTTSSHVQGAHELYLVTKNLVRPEEIPNVYVRAYTELLWSRQFTNVYLCRPTNGAKTIAARFAPTFSSINAIILAIDATCQTSLEKIFRNAEQRRKL